MADTPTISKITLPNGTTYDLKDAKAREDIAAIEQAIAGGVTFMGETTTTLTDGATTNPIIINGNSVTAIKGYLVVSDSKEFVFDGTKWIELGDLTALGALAWKDSVTATYTPAGTVSKPTFTGSSSNVTITTADNASGNYQPKGTVSQPTFTGSATTSTGNFTPAGSVSVSTNATSNKTATVSAAASGTTTYTPGGTVTQPTFSGSAMTSTGDFTPAGTIALSNTNQTTTVSKTSGTATYTPEGSVAAPTISVKTAGTTTTVNSITAVGTLPSLTTTVANENLTLGWDAGTLPTKGSNTTVKTGDAAYEATAPAFTGTGARLVTGNISVPSSATFTGTEAEVSVSGTPSGTVSQPTFSGTAVRLVTGNIPVPSTYTATFTGTQGEVSVSGTPSGTVSQPTFTGTKTQISGTTTAAGSVSQPTFSGTQATITST